jgi:hypothetical protein
VPARDDPERNTTPSNCLPSLIVMLSPSALSAKDSAKAKVKILLKDLMTVLLLIGSAAFIDRSDTSLVPRPASALSATPPTAR